MLGNSSLTIGQYGCLVTSIANYTDLDPDELTELLEFTDSKHKFGAGLLLWSMDNKATFRGIGLDFVGRYRGFTDHDAYLLDQFCKSNDHFPLLEVETKSGSRHWLTPIGRAMSWRGFGWASNDPWDGRRLWKTCGWNAPYVKPTGWLLFKRIKI